MTEPSVSDLLTEAQRRGFLGPGPIAPHVGHALALCVGIAHDARVLDLGSGGGLPGLALAAERQDCHVVLLDGMLRRTAFLEWAVESAPRMLRNVQVVNGRAELVARSVEYRGCFDVVVARSFGVPAATAECAAGFLRVGGSLIVSEPPGGDPNRWKAEGLAQLGLVLDVVETAPVARAILTQSAICPDGYPRRDGVPTRRPLF